MVQSISASTTQQTPVTRLDTTLEQLFIAIEKGFLCVLRDFASFALMLLVKIFFYRLRRS